jgi:hypothetical protein
MKTVFTLISSETPVVKIIAPGCRVNIVLSLLILACNHCLLPRVDWEGADIAGNLRLSGTYGNVRLVRIGIGIDPILARTINRERQVRGIHL